MIQLLDCTLRDGGYCNNWEFGKDNIVSIISGLVDANIDIIECGYLSQNNDSNENSTIFTSFEQIKKIIPSKRDGKLFVAMINFGEFDVKDIPCNDGTQIDGIRIAFKKKEYKEAIKFCKIIKEKGYKIFVQDMVSLSYSDEEFLNLISLVNELNPYVFYIVDSFGMMKGKDLLRLFYTVEHNLSQNIRIGFHSHNNMQLAYSNCLSLTQVQSNRTIIIDSSIYGMGRGAGNLNTELFTEFLNESKGYNYCLKPLLSLVDNIIDGFYQKNHWGYSLSNYISAKNNAHPNYASFLDDKKTLTFTDMNNIFLLMEEEKKTRFDRIYIEQLYLRYLEKEKVIELHKEELKAKLFGRKVILVAPGKSSSVEKEKITLSEGVIMSVNFAYPNSDFIFLSNIRRFNELEKKYYEKAIITSNIDSDEVYYKTRYKDLLNEEDSVKDNAGLMAIKFLIDNGVSEILLAGFDGYSHEARDNYADHSMELIVKNAVLDAMNEGMQKVIRKYSTEINIRFITSPKHILL